MKTIITTIFIVFISIQLQAQKTIEKKIPLYGKKNLSVKLLYANTIEIHTTTEKELYLKAVIAIDKGRLDHKFKIKTEKLFNTVYVESDYGELFKKEKSFFNFFKDKDESLNVTINRKEGENEISINDIIVKTGYVLYVPENIELTLKSTSGNVTINSFVGNLIADITSGDITVKDYNCNLTLETVSGSINLKIGNASTLVAKTTIGKIHKKGHVSKLIIGEKSIGSLAKADFEKGKYAVDLSSVSGNIYLSE